jgi:hypothetical protein
MRETRQSGSGGGAVLSRSYLIFQGECTPPRAVLGASPKSFLFFRTLYEARNAAREARALPGMVDFVEMMISSLGEGW